MFKGIITPVVTPFHRDDAQSINYEATEVLLNHLIRKGVSGIFILGSNGEFHVIDEEEKVEFARFVVKVVAKRVPVFAGTGTCSTRETIRLSQAMEAVGVDALSVITPYFLKPTDEELYAHFAKIAESVQIPIVLYNIPKATGINLSKDVVARLMEVPNIQAIKDSSGDEENLKGYIEACVGTDGSVLLGSDSKILAGYKMGATGAIAGTSNLITDVIVSLDQAIHAERWEEAEALQKDVDVLRNVLKFGTVPSVLKRSLELAHIAAVGPARLPVSETTPETDEAIRSMLQHYELL